MKKKAVLALTLAGLVALQLPMTALADTHQHGGVNVTGDESQGNIAQGIYVNGSIACTTTGEVGSSTYNGNAINATNGATVTADSAKNSSNGSVTVIADNATVTVNGAVTNEGQSRAINALNGATVTAGSATNTGGSTLAHTVSADNATVKVSGAVTNNGENYAIEAKNRATVTAGSATNNSDYNTVSADNATVKIDGAVTHNDKLRTAIEASNGATVTAGSVVSKGEGVDAHNAGTVVTVLGDVVVNGNGSAILAETGAVVTAKNASTTGDGEAVAAHAQDAGTVIVISGDATSGGIGVMAQDGGVIVVEGTVTGTGCGAATEDGGKVIAYEVKSADPAMVEYGDGVYYIIKGTDNTGISNVEGTEDKTVLEKTYKTAVKDTVLKVSVESGYELKAGAIEVTKNADGTYSIKVPAGGGVTLEAVMSAVQQAQAAEAEEKKATVTGTEGGAVIGGQWNVGPGGYWTYRNNGIFKDTWGYITLANGKTGWFYFDKNGVMATGWKKINDKWYYFNEVNDGTQGMMLTNTTTPDGNKVGADGVWIQ